MSINGIGSYQLSASLVYAEQTQHTNAVESDGDVDRSRATAPIDNSGRSGLFSTAISQTLFQIGVTPTAANVATGAAPTGTQQQALTALAQSLFGALQSSDGGSASAGSGKASAPARSNNRATSNTGTPSTSAASGNVPASNLSSGNILQNQLQSLIQELGANNAGTDRASGNAALTQLQQSYDNVIASQNSSSQQSPSLGDFLQSLAQNLQDAPTSGSVINVQA